MPYCQHCGGEVAHPVGDDTPAADAVSAEVQIARINADRDIAVERIKSRQAAAELDTVEAVAEVSADADVAVAEATAEVVAADDTPAEDPGDAPVIVEELPEEEPDLAPPAAEEHESRADRKPAWGFS